MLLGLLVVVSISMLIYALLPGNKEIRDHVIRVFRNASVDELQEPELDTLKARLMDALAAQIGEQEVRQLLITEVVSLKL